MKNFPTNVWWNPRKRKNSHQVFINTYRSKTMKTSTPAKSYQDIHTKY